MTNHHDPTPLYVWTDTGQYFGRVAVPDAIDAELRRWENDPGDIGMVGPESSRRRNPFWHTLRLALGVGRARPAAPHPPLGW